jgi:methionyl aminopeptidase
MAVTIKNAREIGLMREASQVVVLIHQRIEAAIAPGVTTQELDDIARDVFAETGAKSLFLNHHGFTGRICASVNEQIVHGIPGKRFCGTATSSPSTSGRGSAATAGTRPGPTGSGRISDEARRLLIDTEESLYRGVAAAVGGNRLGDIGHAVESYATEHGYGLVREYGGHGIGREMWEDPHVPNHGARGQRPTAPTRHDAGDRADAERRRRRDPSHAGRMDRGDSGRVVVGPLRAHDRDHGRGARDLDATLGIGGTLSVPGACLMHAPSPCASRRTGFRAPEGDVDETHG